MKPGGPGFRQKKKRAGTACTSVTIPSETTTALFAKCLWSSYVPRANIHPMVRGAKTSTEPKHHPVGLTAGSPAKTLSRGAAMRGGPSRKRNGICLPGACGMCGCMMRGIDEYRQQVIWGPMEVIRSNPQCLLMGKMHTYKLLWSLRRRRSRRGGG